MLHEMLIGDIDACDWGGRRKDVADQRWKRWRWKWGLSRE